MRASLLAVLLLLPISACEQDPKTQQNLRELYTPSFAHIPPSDGAGATLRQLARDLKDTPGDQLRQDLRSTQAIVIALAGVIILLVAFDWRRPGNPRNVDILLMYAIGVCLFDVMRFFDVLNRPAYVTLMDWVFSVVVVLSVVVLVRALVRCVRSSSELWRPNSSSSVLAGLTVILFAANLAILLSKPPDDAGWFVNLGAQRLRERGRLPYGDPLLTGTPAAAYGPLLYAAHVPFQAIVSPSVINPDAPARPSLGPASTYYLPPTLATTLCTAFFHLVGVAALWWSARRIEGAYVAWGLTCLYCGSLAVLGIGGSEYAVAGITFVSHIAPASVVLLAYAALPRAALSGTLLAIGAGVGFYPAFMAPAWAGYYWNDRSRRWRFLAAFGLTCAAIALGVVIASRAAPGHTRIETILRDTFGHHTDPSGYGSSPFGFWGQREGVRKVLSTPLVGGSGLTSPAWLALAGLMVASFFLVRGRSAVELALAAGAVAIGATLVKPHATGTYMAWYYGMLLIGFFTTRSFTSRPQKV